MSVAFLHFQSKHVAIVRSLYCGTILYWVWLFYCPYVARIRIDLPGPVRFIEWIEIGC